MQPENIMLLKPKSKKIKLIDFGLSRKLRDDDIVKEMMGTPEFVGKWYDALGPSLDEFGYIEHPVSTSKSFCIKSINGDDETFGYNEDMLTTVLISINW